MRGYLAGGYINGHALPSSTAVFGGRDTFDGWFVTGGLEKNVGGNAAVGVAVSYSEITGNAGTPGQTASSRLLQGSVYGKIDLYKGLMLDGQASGGALFANTRRAVTFLGNPYLLRSGDTPLTLNADIGLSKALPLGGSFTLTPRTAIRAAYVSFDNVAETGGPMALTYDRKTIKNLQTRDGLTLQGNLGGIQPTLTATYVHEFANHQTIVGANFVGGAGPDAFFGLNSTDHDWLEVGGGLTIKGSKVDISVEADTTALRKDASYQTYRGTLTVHF
jgi:uncharacterized protein with beta-barrel porin domain